nr:replisome organizer protein [Balneolaceae bacterium]
MARPKKDTLDYYPKDTTQNSDPKIQYVMAVHGAIGKHIYNTLLDHIYGRDNGYYLVFDDRRKILFCDEEKLDQDTVTSVLETCLEEGLFNKKLYDLGFFLTSEAIQERYLKACYSRTRIELEGVVTLINEEQANELVSKKTTIVFKNKTQVSQQKSTQSKVKKSKVNEIEKGEGNHAGTCYSFNDFWEDYDKPIEKTKTHQMWAGLREEERKAIKKFLPKYKNYEPDPQYRKNPANFLNDRSWENEFVINQVANGKRSDKRKVWFTYQETLEAVDRGRYSHEDFEVCENKRDGNGNPMRKLCH